MDIKRKISNKRSLLFLIINIIINYIYINLISFPASVYYRIIIIILINIFIIIIYYLKLKIKTDLFIYIFICFIIIFGNIRHDRYNYEYIQYAAYKNNYFLEYDKSNDKIKNEIKNFKITFTPVSKIIKKYSYYSKNIMITFFDKNDKVMYKYETNRVDARELISIILNSTEKLEISNDEIKIYQNEIILNENFKKEILNKINAYNL